MEYRSDKSEKKRQEKEELEKLRHSEPAKDIARDSRRYLEIIAWELGFLCVCGVIWILRPFIEAIF